MDSLINVGFANLAHHYRQSMQRFRPCKPGGEVLEQNLITAFLMGCLAECPDALWGVEVPFIGHEKRPTEHVDNNYNTRLTSARALSFDWKNHIDAFLYANGTLYFIEAKRDYPPAEFIKKVEADHARIHSKELALSFHIMLNREVYKHAFGNITHVKGVLLADTWKPSIKALWEQAQYQGRAERRYDLNWLNNMLRMTDDLGFSSQQQSESYSLLIARTDDISASRDIIQHGI